MVRFDYDGIMKRNNVIVPFTIGDESEEVSVASISEDNKITFHRDLSLKLVKQIILKWDEHSHMLEMKAKRESEEFNELLK